LPNNGTATLGGAGTNGVVILPAVSGQPVQFSKTAGANTANLVATGGLFWTQTLGGAGVTIDSGVNIDMQGSGGGQFQLLGNGTFTDNGTLTGTGGTVRVYGNTGLTLAGAPNTIQMPTAGGLFRVDSGGTVNINSSYTVNYALASPSDQVWIQ